MSTERITKGPEESVDSAGQAFAAVLSDCVSCGLLLAKTDDSVRALNAEGADLLQLPVGSRQPLSKLPEPLRKTISQAIKNRQVTQTTAAVETKPGQRLQVGVWIAPAGENELIVAVNRFLPVGPLEPDLQRLDRLASAGILSAGLAHEIKNALVPIKTFTDLLLEKHRDAELGEIVKRELSRVDWIVGRLLKFARPSVATSAPVQLHVVLDYALRLIQHHVQQGSIVVQRDFAARVDTVRGDESQLHQALVNILMNGIEAMGPAGTLTVRTDNPAEKPGKDSAPLLAISIKDTGPGISTENLPRLFEPFFTTKSGGTGLGLAVARRIFAEHQGTISVESRVGKGATFIISLPVFAGENLGALAGQPTTGSGASAERR